MFRHKQKEYFPKHVVEQRSRVDRGEAQLLNSSLSRTVSHSTSLRELWKTLVTVHDCRSFTTGCSNARTQLLFFCLSLVFCGHWQNTVILWIAWSQPEAETARLTHTDSIATVCNDDATREWIMTETEMEMLFCTFRMWCTLKDMYFWQHVMRSFF